MKAINNGQSRETGKIGYTRHRRKKIKITTQNTKICATLTPPNIGGKPRHLRRQAVRASYKKTSLLLI